MIYKQKKRPSATHQRSISNLINYQNSFTIPYRPITSSSVSKSWQHWSNSN